MVSKRQSCGSENFRVALCLMETPMIDDSYPVYLLVIDPDIRCSNINSIYNIIMMCLNIHTHLFVHNNKTLELPQITLYIYTYCKIHKWRIPMIPESTRWVQFPDASRGLFNKITTVMEPTSCSLTAYCRSFGVANKSDT